MATLVLAVLAPTSALADTDDLDVLTERRESAERDLDEITADLERSSARLADAHEDRDRLLTEVRALSAEAEAAERVLAHRAATAYRDTAREPLALLLSSEQSVEALDRSRLLEGMGRRERAAIEEAAATQLAYRQRRARLDELVAKLEAEENLLADLRAELDVVYAETRRREVEVASRRDRQRRVSRGSQQEGIYACPIAEPFHFRDTWGDPRSGGRRHRGVDIFGPMGADVYAITDGEIVRHSNSRLGGIGLYLRGDDRNVYYYAHLKEILDGYEPGRRVEAGELIALNGSTGNASPDAPHIHMEIRPGGGAHVNPYPFAAAACF